MSFIVLLLKSANAQYSICLYSLLYQRTDGIPKIQLCKILIFSEILRVLCHEPVPFCPVKENKLSIKIINYLSDVSYRRYIFPSLCLFLAMRSQPSSWPRWCAASVWFCAVQGSVSVVTSSAAPEVGVLP